MIASSPVFHRWDISTSAVFHFICLRLWGAGLMAGENEPLDGPWMSLDFIPFTANGSGAARYMDHIASSFALTGELPHAAFLWVEPQERANVRCGHVLPGIILPHGGKWLYQAKDVKATYDPGMMRFSARSRY